MDPSANLAEQRRLVALLLADGAFGVAGRAAAERLAELVEALDAWITKGGALPEAWARAKS